MIYNEKKYLAKKHGICLATLRYRIEKKHMTPEQAIRMKPHEGSGRRRQTTTFDKSFNSETRKERTCLYCGLKFMSSWAGNRRCCKCEIATRSLGTRASSTYVTVF